MPLLGVTGFLNIISSPLSQLSVVNLSIVVLGKRNKCTKKLKKTKPSCSSHTARKGVYSLGSLPCSPGGAGKGLDAWETTGPSPHLPCQGHSPWDGGERSRTETMRLMPVSPDSSFPSPHPSPPRPFPVQTVVDLNFWHYEGRLFSHLRPCPYFSVIYTNY